MTLKKLYGYALATISIIIGSMLLIDKAGLQSFMTAIIVSIIIVAIVFLVVYLIFD